MSVCQLACWLNGILIKLSDSMRLNAIDWLAFEPSDRQAEVDFLILVKKIFKTKRTAEFLTFKTGNPPLAQLNSALCGGLDAITFRHTLQTTPLSSTLPAGWMIVMRRQINVLRFDGEHPCWHTEDTHSVSFRAVPSLLSTVRQQCPDRLLMRQQWFSLTCYFPPAVWIIPFLCLHRVTDWYMTRSKTHFRKNELV